MPSNSAFSPAHSHPTSSLQPSPSSLENLGVLRTQWKWAAFCQFFFTFTPLFAMNNVSITDIELDLIEGTSRVIPRIITRLLYTLSYDRKVSIENWQSMLRKQYAKRAPDLNPLGAEPQRALSTSLTEDGTLVDESVPQAELRLSASSDNINTDHAVCPEGVLNNEYSDWLRLPMLQKLNSMHLLTEWQFQHPMRLRTLMKSDDEHALWRTEPIGYDKQRNAYWLIGPDRLWIQRAPPKPQKRRTRYSNDERNQEDTSRKRRRLDKDIKSDSRNKYQTMTKHRVAKTRATLKMDARTETLSEIGHASDLQDTKHQTNSHSIVGTRVSARLRGVQQDEWQPVAGERMTGLNEGEKIDSNSIQRPSGWKTGLESDMDDMSELTELSEDDHDSDKEPDASMSIANHSSGAQDIRRSFDEPQEDFQDDVEWETICVTLNDWECISDRFASGTHYSEKVLYKTLVKDLVPIVIENLKVAERQKRLEEAITYRKRSSRIALKESEKEQALAATRKQAEEEERLSRAKRLEARQQREEERQLRLENAKIQRRKEREPQYERDIQAEQGTTHAILRDSPDSNLGGLPESHPSSTYSANDSTSSRIGSWVLDCEICHKCGLSPADNAPMMSCGSCLKWQHIACHDKVNQRAGLPKPMEPGALRDDTIDRLLSRARQSSTTDEDTTPGSHYKHPMAVCDSVWHPLSTSPSTQIDDAGVSLQGQTVVNPVRDQTRREIPFPPQDSYLQPLSESLQHGERRDWTTYERSSMFNQNRGISRPSFKLSPTMQQDHPR
ncbi:hypothetical protein AX15_006928 [Amanita polypyramis BW_CC]|nr:hypothetical protein AX15_006928 [Amanita polypyramis BW_CC]